MRIAFSAISSVGPRVGARAQEILEAREAECVHEPQRLVDRLLELALQLLGRAEEVRVVLREAAHARETVERSAELEAVHRAELAVAQRQIAVRPPVVPVDEDVAGAIHRLEPEALALDLDRAEHRVGEVLEVARRRVEVLVHDVRRDDRQVTALAQPVADELLDEPAHQRALGMPEHEPAAGQLVDVVEVELGAQLAVVALRRLFEERVVVVELLLRRKRGAVDALEHRVLRVAAPIRTGHGLELDRTDRAGGVGVAAAAQVGEVADRVERDRLAVGDRARQLDLVRVVAERFDRFFARHAPAGHRVVRADDLAHPRLQLRQIVRRERFGAIEIVVEPVLDRRPDRRLGLGKEILDGVREHVGRGVAEVRDVDAARGGHVSQSSPCTTGVPHPGRSGRATDSASLTAQRGRDEVVLLG